MPSIRLSVVHPACLCLWHTLSAFPLLLPLGSWDCLDYECGWRNAHLNPSFQSFGGPDSEVGIPRLCSWPCVFVFKESDLVIVHTCRSLCVSQVWFPHILGTTRHFQWPVALKLFRDRCPHRGDVGPHCSFDPRPDDFPMFWTLRNSSWDEGSSNALRQSHNLWCVFYDKKSNKLANLCVWEAQWQWAIHCFSGTPCAHVPRPHSISWLAMNFITLNSW